MNEALSRTCGRWQRRRRNADEIVDIVVEILLLAPERVHDEPQPAHVRVCVSVCVAYTLPRCLGGRVGRAGGGGGCRGVGWLLWLPG